MTDSSRATVQQLAERLWQAEIDRVAISPITQEHEDLAVEDAYAIQTYNIDRRIAAGATRWV